MSSVPSFAPAPPQATLGRRGALVPSFPAWGLTWRTLVMGLGVALVVPAPWAGVWYYRWFAERIALPDARPFRLAATAGDSWMLFVALGLVEWAGAGLAGVLGNGAGNLVALVVNAALGAWLVRWFTARLRTDDGGTGVAFEGSVLGFVGWNILLFLSIFTVIGWAWVLKAWTNWIARAVRGSFSAEFTGTGLELLWRTLVFGVGAALIIPIPWALKWWTNWFVSRFVVTPA